MMDNWMIWFLSEEIKVLVYLGKFQRVSAVFACPKRYIHTVLSTHKVHSFIQRLSLQPGKLGNR